MGKKVRQMVIFMEKNRGFCGIEWWFLMDFTVICYMIWSFGHLLPMDSMAYEFDDSPKESEIMERSTIFHGKIHYKSPFEIAMLMG